MLTLAVALALHATADPMITPMPIPMTGDTALVQAGAPSGGAGDPAAVQQPAATMPAAPPAPLTPAAAAPDPAPAPAGAMDLAFPAPGGADAGPNDPLIKLNRAIFNFDTGLDKVFLAPVAGAYNAVFPKFLRFHLTLLLANLDEPLTALNDLLQLKLGRMATTVGRFAINSSIGLGGFFDVATPQGIKGHVSDFGQTLGRYGVHPGAYLMIPLLGPSDVRDAVGRLVDSFADPLVILAGGFSTFGLSRVGANILTFRADNAPLFKALYETTDPYSTMRSGYIQARQAQVEEVSGRAAVLPDFDSAATKP